MFNSSNLVKQNSHLHRNNIQKLNWKTLITNIVLIAKTLFLALQLSGLVFLFVNNVQKSIKKLWAAIRIAILKTYLESFGMIISLDQSLLEEMKSTFKYKENMEYCSNHFSIFKIIHALNGIERSIWLVWKVLSLIKRNQLC